MFSDQTSSPGGYSGAIVPPGQARTPAPVTLTGRYVELQPLALAHAPDLFEALRNDDQIALQQFTADPVVANVEEMRSLIAAKQATGAATYFACIEQTARKAAGYACLMRVDVPNRVVEIGNVLFTRTLRRSRAGTEAIYLLARHAFDDLGFRRVEWKCNDHNAASRHAALRYGFHFEGVFRQHMIVKGRNRDTAWYSMLDREWPKLRETFEAWLAPENFDAEGRQISSLAQLNGIGGS